MPAPSSFYAKLKLEEKKIQLRWCFYIVGHNNVIFHQPGILSSTYHRTPNLFLVSWYGISVSFQHDF